MDVLYFYKERTRFIRLFYDTAAIPFETTMKAIEDELPPFDDPPYSEDGEPAYLVEWIEASEALEVLGRTCLSMLSPSLQLYFRTWERELGVQWEDGDRKKVFKKGFIEGYMTCFEQVLGISRRDCPADLGLIEQITLARNRDQHPEKITTMRVSHSKTDREKHGHLFFMSEQDSAMFSNSDIADVSFLDPAVHVSRDQLRVAIGETEKLSNWLEKHMIAKRWGR
ncbi:hypothetical protein [Roseovarius aestuarii]|uniref:Uncharacterized protein n=1 Tax=Roseovarius aestuarii TaxID=475083 RepID=A0A1X7BVP3_9RHOB|nr:hypothetical protein [Roseovarius aestuarii]SMC13716.1 hypothetical protein ROA7745_03575 [Roseovarius aestuarii]